MCVQLNKQTNKKTKNLRIWRKKNLSFGFQDKKKGETVKIWEIRKKPVNVLGFFSKCPGLKNKKTPPIKTLWNPKFCSGARNPDKPRRREKFQVSGALREPFGFPKGPPTLNFSLRRGLSGLGRKFFEKIVINVEKIRSFYRSFPIWMNECKQISR